MFWIVCPIPYCGKVYQDWNGIMTKEEVEQSFRHHLTGKHCLKGEAYKKACQQAQRHDDSAGAKKK